MRFCADENFPGDAVRALRARCHDVDWVLTEAPGSLDRAVLARATAQNRVRLTLDKDFGELTFRLRLATPEGVILFRLPGAKPDDMARRVVEVVESRESWRDTFAVVTHGRLRVVTR
jgi:predicted nuclease of predicted toxin-antitoxin system